MSLLVGKVNDAFRNSVQSTVYSTLNAFRGIFRIGFWFITTSTVVIWAAIFFYSLFYYSYMPNAPQLIRPVHLQFESSPDSQGANSYLSANVSLIKRGEENIFLRGLPYSIQYDLEMPESPANLAAAFHRPHHNDRLSSNGMFMVKILLFNHNGDILVQSSRATVIRYKSIFMQAIQAVASTPRMFFGTFEESQTVTVELLEEFEQNVHKPATKAFIEVQSKFVQVYSSRLRIVAKFTGIRYILYTHSWLAALAGVCINIYFLSLIAVLSWWHYLGNPTPQGLFAHLISIVPQDSDDSDPFVEDLDHKNYSGSSSSTCNQCNQNCDGEDKKDE